MCWAAQSSNMLGYWQNLYVAAGNTLPERTPSGNEEIYEYFTSNWTDETGNSMYAIPWYMTGDFIDGYDGTSSLKEGADAAGFFSALYPTSDDLFNSDTDWNPTGDLQYFSHAEVPFPDYFLSYSTFSRILISKLSGNSVVGLGVELSGTQTGGHALTLWGCDYDDSDLVTTIYITDSDDLQTGIKPITLSGDDSNIYLTNYLNDGTTVSVAEFSTLSVNRFLSQIPEPSAFGLLAGTFALALVSVRRRRKIS